MSVTQATSDVRSSEEVVRGDVTQTTTTTLPPKLPSHTDVTINVPASAAWTPADNGGSSDMTPPRLIRFHVDAERLPHYDDVNSVIDMRHDYGSPSPCSPDSPIQCVTTVTSVVPHIGGNHHPTTPPCSSSPTTLLCSSPPTSYERFMRWHIYSRIDLLVQSSCLRPPWYFAWRLFVVLWTMAAWSLSIGLVPSPKFPTFLTHWTHTSVMLYYMAQFYICTRYYLNVEHSTPSDLFAHSVTVPSSSYTPHAHLLRVTHVLGEHAFAWCVLVVLVYWGFIFTVDLDEHNDDPLFHFRNATVHAVPIVTITIDLLLTRIEMVWTHLSHTMAASVLYTIVNGVYVGVSGDPIYDLLSWDGWFTAVALAGCGLIVTLAYPLGHGLCILRNRCASNVPPQGHEDVKWCACSSHGDDEEQQQTDHETQPTIAADTRPQAAASKATSSAA